eukprot:TRINITY_DN10096_c0_g1_i1.p1 TRINITY_DN10096_c0_g1~~TRINITY_DN10096_c0_g1_i1.p1  ORF type:complete len:339 (+),score=73.70 TRINITY_DN10096_c0_g1_i1:29-1045(+)
MENASEEYTFKVLMLGESGVGKTQLRLRFVKDAAPTSTEPTFGVDFASRVLSIGKSAIRLQLWDTAGMKRYRHHNPAMIYRHSVCALLIYDVTARESFQSLQQWVDELNAAGDVDPSRMVLVVVGNKTDLPDRQVSTEEGKKYADAHNFLFCEISALKAQEVDDMFRNIAADILNRIEEVDESESTLSERVPVRDVSPPVSQSEVVLSTPEQKLAESPKTKKNGASKPQVKSPPSPSKNTLSASSPVDGGDVTDSEKENIQPAHTNVRAKSEVPKPQTQFSPKSAPPPLQSSSAKAKATAKSPAPAGQTQDINIEDLPGPPTSKNKKKTEQCQCCTLQ